MITKAQATYTWHPDVNYTCGSCVFHKEIKDSRYGCAYFGPQFAISKDRGSCNYWTHGDPSKQFDVPWLGLFTKQELGYEESANGFSCGRCEEFKVGKNACKKVDKDSPGDTPGEISPNGCCSLWEADSHRSKLNDQQLVHLLVGKSSGPTSISINRK